MADRRIISAILLEELAEDDLFTQFNSNQTLAMDVMNVSLNAVSLVLSSRSDPVRVEGYVPEVVSIYSDLEFKSHFRMQRSTFEMLCTEVAPEFPRERSINLETKMLATLWLLGTQECYRSVGDRFGMSKGTLHLIVQQVCRVISDMRETYIRMPRTRQEMERVEKGFREKCGMPGVVGAIDGTHIAIPGPSEHRSSYINRKGYQSMQLQVVCDSQLKFLDTYTGWPGSVHDARVYRNSPISETVSNLPHDKHLLGDSAYPLKVNMLVPFRDNGHLNRVEKKFNKVHSSTRVDVERAIGLLKCKFRRLKHLDMLMVEEIPVTITSCCVLHNYILENDCDDSEESVDDFSGGDADIDQTDNMENVSGQAAQKRQHVANLL
ncbi:putative nuclease HARBI1 [Ruditapes philippinarum]|uniref:putative nuclease HARBI1 n=1 Tax=Ruditapes philippinarum TaxID=129788 RepID=UPI00295B37AB|nr:putative nuclease HARBI1 [Ruditapes philippinarum]